MKNAPFVHWARRCTATDSRRSPSECAAKLSIYRRGDVDPVGRANATLTNSAFSGSVRARTNCSSAEADGQRERPCSLSCSTALRGSSTSSAVSSPTKMGLGSTTGAARSFAIGCGNGKDVEGAGRQSARLAKSGLHSNARANCAERFNEGQRALPIAVSADYSWRRGFFGGERGLNRPAHV